MGVTIIMNASSSMDMDSEQLHTPRRGRSPAPAGPPRLRRSSPVRLPLFREGNRREWNPTPPGLRRILFSEIDESSEIDSLSSLSLGEIQRDSSPEPDVLHEGWGVLGGWNDLSSGLEERHQESSTDDTGRSDGLGDRGRILWTLDQDAIFHINIQDDDPAEAG